MSDEQEPVIGIDLGTTNSCVAAVVDGVPTVFANKSGYKTTPSVFAVARNGRRVVGQIAKRQAVTNPENTIYAAKRLIGRPWDSIEREKAEKTMPFHLARGAHDDIRVRVGGETLAIPEISAQILTEMRQVAEATLQRRVKKAVVTVPAHFNDTQRHATKDAGEIAGLEVIRIINEPTAAALAYGFGRELDRRLAIYDMGGGTFDVSLLRVSAGIFDVIATGGDTYLGGEDFDLRIIDWLAEGFQEEHGVDLREDRMALQRLKDSAEKAKCDLSLAQNAELNLPFIYSAEGKEALHLQRALTRQTLESITRDLVDRSIEVCREIVQEAGMRPEEIDEVLLVGGQTRMPLIQQAVTEFFGKAPSKGVHPDEVVATGAAIQASLLVQPERDMLLLDVTPLSLGIMIVGGYFQRLIERNTTVPTSATHTFTTVSDNQEQVKIVVLQGESKVAAENELLGEFMLSGLRPAPRGEVEVDVTFEISADGIVGVRATDKETGQAQAITVTASYGLEDQEIAQMAERNQDYLLELKQNEAFEEARVEAQRLTREIDRLAPDVEKLVAGSDFGADALAKARDTVQRANAAMESGDLGEMEGARDALSRTVQVFRGLVERG